jgi:hypothetical protein
MQVDLIEKGNGSCQTSPTLAVQRHKIDVVMEDVTTLALGSWPRQALARVRSKREAR